MAPELTVTKYNASEQIKYNVTAANSDDYSEDYYTAGTLKSFIAPLRKITAGYNWEDMIQPLNQNCFLGGDVFTRCRYMDYGDATLWAKNNKYRKVTVDHVDYWRNQIMVNWQIPGWKDGQNE
jgi:hypothetical protein